MLNSLGIVVGTTASANTTGQEQNPSSIWRGFMFLYDQKTKAKVGQKEKYATENSTRVIRWPILLLVLTNI